MLRIRLHFLPDMPKLELLTFAMYGGKYYMGFVGNLLKFPAVKEF